MEKSRFGTVYHDDKACEPGLCFTTSNKITLGDSVDGKEISWAKYKDMYIADRCVTTAISWNKLNEQGFVYGVPVKIDGRHYLCRCLKIGTRKNEDCEWNDILRELGDSNVIWNWRHMYFWGQEESPRDPDRRMVWGYNGNDRKRSSYFATVQIPVLGFRPALEPLPPTLSDFDGLVGTRLRVYGPNGFMLPSILIGADDYDLTLRPLIPLPANCDWAIRKGPMATVDRDAVRYICKEEETRG